METGLELCEIQATVLSLMALFPHFSREACSFSFIAKGLHLSTIKLGRVPCPRDFPHSGFIESH